MRGEPTISVVIPTHRRPDLVQRAVRSVMAQTLPAAQVVVVVDGACEETTRVLAALDLPTLTVVQVEPAGGAAAARNLGVRAATGDWVALLDDDDEWLPTKLARQWASVQEVEDPSLCVFSTRATWLTERESFEWPRRAPRSGEPVAEYLFVRDMPGEGLIPTPTVLLPTALARRVPMPEQLRVHEDYDWFLRLEDAGATFRVLEEPLTVVHAPRARQSASRSSTWSRSMDWATGRRARLGERAFAAFLLSDVARSARDARAVAGLLLVLRTALTARPRGRDLLRFVVVVALPEQLRWRLGALLARVRR